MAQDCPATLGARGPAFHSTLVDGGPPSAAGTEGQSTRAICLTSVASLEWDVEEGGRVFHLTSVISRIGISRLSVWYRILWRAPTNLSQPTPAPVLWRQRLEDGASLGERVLWMRRAVIVSLALLNQTKVDGGRCERQLRIYSR
jgi:hypothetical protein